MVAALALIVGSVAVALIWAAVTGQSVISEFRAGLGLAS